MLIIGVTGNIGCGKSSISNIFRSKDIDIVDADIISRQIYEDKELLEMVFKTFGEFIKNEDGTLNRKALGNIVFNDDAKLIKLNSITHPKIKENIFKELKTIEKNNKKIAILDGALLIEGKYLDYIDKLIVVTCKEEVQVGRIIKRDNCTREEAISRIKSQMSQVEKSKYADYIIDNSGTIDELKDKIHKIMCNIKEN